MLLGVRIPTVLVLFSVYGTDLALLLAAIKSVDGTNVSLVLSEELSAAASVAAVQQPDDDEPLVIAHLVV